MNTDLPPPWVWVTCWAISILLVWMTFFAIAFLITKEVSLRSLVITGGMTVFASAATLTFKGNDDYMDMP